MDYTILEYDNKARLLYEILEYIENGWIPQGGVAKAIDPDYDATYSQAMIKPAIPEPKELS